MNRVFVDTGGFYASLNRRDAYHRDAARLFRRAQREHWFLFTTNLIKVNPRLCRGTPKV